MKKICFITTTPGTIRSFILPTIRYIHENTDWNISVICCYDEEFKKELPDYVKYITVPMKRGLNLSVLKNMLKIKKIFKRERFDLIQYSTPNASLCASIAGWLAHVPVRLYCQWGIVFSGYSGLSRKIFKIEEKIVCKLSTTVEPDSLGNLKFSIEEKLYDADKGHVIGYGSACGVNTDKFDINRKDEHRKEIRKQYNISDDTFVYVYVGRVNRDKGVNELLEAYKNLIADNKDSLLFVIGREEETEKLNQDLHTWSKNEKSIIYTGLTMEVEKYLSASDCYILPSYREGFGMGVIEAESMKLPIIVTDIPGPTDAVDDKCALVVPVKDAKALGDAMRKIRDIDLKSMGEHGYQIAMERYEQRMLLSKILEDRKKLLGV